jgi:hypothetical protein
VLNEALLLADIAVVNRLLVVGVIRENVSDFTVVAFIALLNLTVNEVILAQLLA